MADKPQDKDLGFFGELRHRYLLHNQGINDGFGSLLASIAGTPRNLWDFAKERITGERPAREEVDRTASRAWFEKRIADNRAVQDQMMGRERAVPRLGTDDREVYENAQLVPIVASFLVPGVGSLGLAAKGERLMGTFGRVAGTVAGRFGVQLNLLDMGTIGVQLAENVAGITRPVEGYVPNSDLGAAPVTAPKPADKPVGTTLSLELGGVTK